jgi:hypothetical protein
MCIEKTNIAQILVKWSCCLVANMPSNVRLVNDFRFKFFSHFRMEKIRLDWSGIHEWRRHTWWKATESLVPSPHWIPCAIEHCHVILCIDVLLQFNLDFVILNQFHVISFHIFNLAKWLEPWQVGATWIQDVTNEIPWMQMNKLGKHYQKCLCHGGLIVGVLLNLDLAQLIDQGDRENHNVVIRRILIFSG